MNYFRQFFQSSKTKLSTELVCPGQTSKNDAKSPGEVETAICATPNESRRIIRTADGLDLVLSSNDVQLIELLRSMFENLKPIQNSNNPPVIVIPISIDSITIQRIIDWCRSSQNNKSINFDKFYKNISIQDCIKLIEASLFMETKSLDEAASQWVASKLEGKSMEEMAQMLNMPNHRPLSDDRQKKVKLQNQILLN